MKQDQADGFELLDEQEPSAAPRPARLSLELLLGVFLLVAVVGWSGWDWWHQQAALADYRAGERYAASRDWDTAHAAFLAAGDFEHAAVRAADAAKQIRDRDAAYAAARAAGDAGQWAAALRDFRQVLEIEPGFRDSADLEEQAEQQVYMLALSGTVALRVGGTPAGNPPGLYLYMANGWNYLPGSDASSRVRSNSAAACLVYDAPSSSLSRRSLRVARYGTGTLTTQPLAFDPGEFAWFTCGDTGVMGQSDAARGGSYLDIRLAYARGIQFYSPTYQAYNSAVITRAPLSGPAWAILADDRRMRLAVGDYTDVLGYHPRTRLYISSSLDKWAAVLGTNHPFMAE